jgi:hypothetical protein
VKDHAAHRHFGFEHLVEMPADALALAIFVCRQDQLIGVFELALELGHNLFLGAGDDIEWVEIFIDIDAQARPGFPFIIGRNFGSRGRQIANMPHAGFDVIALRQIIAYGFCFGR